MTISSHATFDIEQIYFEKSIWRIRESKVYLLNGDHTNWEGMGATGKTESSLNSASHGEEGKHHS